MLREPWSRYSSRTQRRRSDDCRHFASRVFATREASKSRTEIGTPWTTAVHVIDRHAYLRVEGIDERLDRRGSGSQRTGGSRNHAPSYHPRRRFAATGIPRRGQLPGIENLEHAFDAILERTRLPSIDRPDPGS